MDYYGVNEKTLIERRWKLINTRGKNVFNNLTYYIISITDHISSKRSLILVKNIFLYFYLKLYSFLSWKTDYRIKFCIKLERLQITWKNITKGDQRNLFFLLKNANTFRIEYYCQNIWYLGTSFFQRKSLKKTKYIEVFY